MAIKKLILVLTVVLLFTPLYSQTSSEWYTQLSGTNDCLRGIVFTDASRGWAVGNNGTIVKTSNKGKIWNKQNSGTAAALYSVDFIDSLNGLAAGGNVNSSDAGVILRTTNGGSSWSQTSLPLLNTIQSICYSGPSTAIAVGLNGKIYRSTNNGADWSSQSAGETYLLSSVSFSDPLYGIIVGGDLAGTGGLILRTTNGGITWIKQESGTDKWLRNAVFTDALNGLAVGDSGTVLRTDNGGSTWIKQNSTVSGKLTSICYTGTSSAVAVGENGTIIYSADGGISWNRQTTSTTSNLLAVMFADNNSGTAACSDGTILSTQNTGISFIITSPNSGEVWYSNFNRVITWKSVYPGSSTLRIQYSSDNGSSWQTLSASTPAANGKFTCAVPSVPSASCRIKLTDNSDQLMYDISDDLFSVATPQKNIEYESNNSAALANYIQAGDTIHALISEVNDLDYYRLKVSEGDTLQFYSASRLQSDLQGILILYNENGSYISHNAYFNGTTRNQRILYIARTEGILYLRYSTTDNGFNFSQAKSEDDKLSLQKNILNKQSGTASPNGIADGNYILTYNKFTPSIPNFSDCGFIYTNSSSARLWISIFSNGLPTKAKFEYGTTTSYGNILEINQTPVSSLTEDYFQLKITGLQPQTTYHYRLVLSNAKGQSTSGDMHFTTSGSPDGFVTDVFNNDAHIAGISFFDSDNGIAVGENTIFSTTNGGSTWTQREQDWRINYAAASTAINTYYVISNNSTIRKTTDGGNIWIQQTCPVNSSLSCIDFSDASNGIIAGSDVILKTTNGGGSWIQKAIPFSGSFVFNSVSFVTSTIAYLTGNNGIILKSTDGGNSWLQQICPVSNNLFGIYFTDGKNGFAVGDNIVLRTTNGGDSWTQHISSNNLWLKSVSFSDKYNGAIVGSGGTLLITTDSGNTWIRKESGTAVNLNSVSVKKNIVAAGGYFGVICRKNIPNPLKWQAVITVTNKENMNLQNLEIGQSAQAGDGIDKTLGENPLPPAPPADVFDARLKLPNNTGFSLKDYRNEEQKAQIWQISLQSAGVGYPLTISWDSDYFPEGAFYLKDAAGDSLVNVNMKSQNSYTLDNNAFNLLNIEMKPASIKNVSLAGGWNLVSVPVEAENMDPKFLYPALSADAYSFLNGYQSAALLENGKGYWIKYPQIQSFNIYGNEIALQTINVNSGWNLIGVYDREADVGLLTTTPSGIINSSLFGYSGSYYAASKLEPGKGYWVRTSEAGQIKLNYTASAISRTADSQPDEKFHSGLCIKDNAGSSARIYFVKQNLNPKEYDLPPLPPEGVMDVRFANDKYAESSASGIIRISNAAYPIKISAEGACIRISDLAGGRQLNKKLSDGESLVIDAPNISVINAELESTPAGYSLEQNYPNPFNPSTKIRFTVAERGEVYLVIYNHLGEKVKELVKGIYEPGSYTAEWMAAGMASGVYLCYLSANDFRYFRKLLLLK